MNSVNLSDVFPILSLPEALAGLLLALVLVVVTALLFRSLRRLLNQPVSPTVDNNKEPRMPPGMVGMAFQAFHRRQ